MPFHKNDKSKKTTGRSDDRPEALEPKVGMANLVHTPNGHTLIEIAIPFHAIYEILTQDALYDLIKQYAGWEDAEERLWIKLKGVPLREPKANKTHFLEWDWFVPDPNKRKE